MNYNVGLIGAGAVGLYYTSFLAEQGCSITVFTRNIYDYDDRNIIIDSHQKPRSFSFDQVVGYGSTCNIEFDLIIVATKALPNIDAAKLAKPYVSQHTVILIIQNGLDIETPFLNRFKQPILRGLGFICVKRESKNRVQHLDYGPLTLGVIQGHSKQPLLQSFFNILDHSDLDYDYVDDIQAAIWKKLLWNAAFNPLSVFYGGVDTLFLLENARAFNDVNEIMDDVINVARCVGVNLSDSLKEEMISNTMKMRPYKTSMCLDFESNLPLEIDAILGNLIRIAQRFNQPVPKVSFIYNNLLKNT